MVTCVVLYHNIALIPAGTSNYFLNGFHEVNLLESMFYSSTKITGGVGKSVNLEIVYSLSTVCLGGALADRLISVLKLAHGLQY